jgi:hypothetical protein
MFRPTCGDYACVLSLFAHKAAGAAKHPAFPAPSLIEGRQSLRQSPGAISSVAGMRRRVIESANAVIRKTGETVVPGLDRVKPAKDPTGVIARVSEATQSFLISQGDAASLHFGQLQIGHKGEFQFFGSRGKRICWRSAPLSAVVWHHRARRRPNEASACDASAC